MATTTMRAGGRLGTTSSTQEQPPWFADCAPSLLTNSTVRRYLEAFSAQLWPEAIKLTLIYGILGLQQQFPQGPLSLAELRCLVERGGASLVVDAGLPRLRRDILALQSGLDAVFDRLAVEAVPAEARPSPPVPAVTSGAPPVQRPQQQHAISEARPGWGRSSAPLARPRSALNPGPVALKAPGAWRAGEPTGFPAQPRTHDHALQRSQDNQGATNPIYPDWWLAAGPAQPAPAAAQPPARTRRQPRLAYSVQQPGRGGPAARSAASDDLVTAEYLAVPSSGYGQQQAPSTTTAAPKEAPAQTAAALLAGVQAPAAAAAAATSASGPAAKRRLAEEGGRPGTLLMAPPQRVRHAPSKVKAALDAARLQAAARQQERQHVLAAAVGAAAAGSSAPQPERQQRPARVGIAAAAADDALAPACPSAAAADQFLSNPWTAWFVQPAAAAGGGESAHATDDQAEGRGAGSRQHMLPPLLEGDEAGEAAAGAAVAADLDDSEQREEDSSEPQLLMLAQQLRRLGSSSSKPDGSSTAASAAASPARIVFADITAGRLNAGRAQHSAPPVQHVQQRHTPWAHDFGHLENVEAAAATGGGSSSSSGGQRGSRAHKKKWSEQWVGDFGHLDEYPRFGPETAWGGAGQEADQQGADGSSRLFMSPADLQQLVDAASRLQAARSEAAAATAAVAAAVTATTEQEAAPAAQAPDAAAASAGDDDDDGEEEGFETGSSGDMGDAQGSSSSRQALGAASAGQHLDGLQETSAMLQAALTRHDTLMQLIASLQAGDGAPESELSLLLPEA